MVSRKVTCPQCGREKYTQSPNCRCSFCLAKWTIEWKMTPEEFWSYNSTPKAQKAIAKTAALIGVDPKALHILFNTQWSLDGKEGHWISFSQVPPEDLTYAQERGLIQEPWELDHQALISRLITARDAIDRRAVAVAFASSLMTRRLDTRSTLGSYARVLHLTSHKFCAGKSGDICRKCGLEQQERISVNHFTFRRIMWAGNVCQGDLGYALVDLSRFEEQATKLGRDEKDVLNQVFSALRSLPQEAGLSALEKSLAGVFPSNKQERQVVLEILGLAGILKPKGCPSLHEEWIPVSEMPSPTSVARKEWRSPVNCWIGSDGVNESAVEFWFGDL